MDGTGRACLGCQAELGPNARFCPKCGRPAGIAAPGGPVPGDPVPGSPVPGEPGPGPGDGPGFTMVTPLAPALPSPGWGTPAAAGRGEPTATYPPPAYQHPSYRQGPGDPQAFEPFRPYQPGAPTAGPLQGPPRQPPRRHDRDRSGTPLALWIIVLVILVGGGAAAALLIAHPFGHPSLRETASTGTGRTPAARPGTASGTTSPAASSPASAVTEQQAAASMATMLAQSVSDRAAINSAASDVGSCGPNLASDPKVFDDAASSRQSLLASLTTMPGRATLPAALVSDLTQAWQASTAADQAYAKWATDEITQGCVPNDTTDPGYQATITPNRNATKYKTAFVAQWNPIAARYGLRQYQQGQL
jgi:hypothetical protein